MLILTEQIHVGGGLEKLKSTIEWSKCLCSTQIQPIKVLFRSSSVLKCRIAHNSFRIRALTHPGCRRGVVLRQCSTNLCVAVYTAHHTRCPQRWKTNLQITALCRLQTPAWLAQTRKLLDKATWQLSHTGLTWPRWHQQLSSKDTHADAHTLTLCLSGSRV